uniref:THH1/TOM1/TOM3 domain-containing protein n=1 Tax=Aegilops tauschii subsp. strangulata TaxID=200361 RepID=A0A453FIM3_AEGTS
PAAGCAARHPQLPADPPVAAASSSPTGMSRYYAPFRGAASGDGGGCLPLPIIAAEAALAVVDAAIAATAFVQLARIHRHNQQHGWTRQKVCKIVMYCCSGCLLPCSVTTYDCFQ